MSERRRLTGKGRAPARAKEELSADARFVLANRDAAPMAYARDRECEVFLHEQDFYYPRSKKAADRHGDFFLQEERNKAIKDKYAELETLSLEQVCTELIASGKKEWAKDMLRFAALRAQLRAKIKALPDIAHKHVKRRTWAQASSLTAKTFEQHLEKLEITAEDLKGKRILALGPGTDFAFEKGAVDAGAEFVVALSYSYDRHESPEQVHAERPNLYPVRGLFQELPPMDGMFDKIYSVHAFPRAVDAMEKLADEKAETADVKERYVAALSLLDSGGEYRSYPIMSSEIPAVKRLPKRVKDRVSVEMREKDHSWSPDLMIIRVKG